MPQIRNTRELREAATNRNFLNDRYPQYRTVNQFTRKLMDLQDKLKNVPEEIQLHTQVSKYAKDLMTLQMHGIPLTTEDELSTAITDVTVDLPYFLKTPTADGEEKTGYQQLVEAGDKYGVFSKAELDEALTLVGQGMGVDLGVDAPDKEKQKEEEEKEAQRKAEEEAKQAQAHAEQQAAIDAQANIAMLEDEAEQKRIEEEMAGEVREEAEELPPFTDKWLQQHRETLRKNTGKYMPQGPLPQKREIGDTLYMQKSGQDVGYALKRMGILETGYEEYPPERKGAPSVFVMKDGKIKSLKEAGLWISRKKGNLTEGNPELTKAVLRGEVFAYPPGERYPVQIQGNMEKHGSSMNVTHSAPLDPSGAVRRLEIPPEPPVTREPRWYHRAFKFWGNNRRICEEYAATSAAHEKWQREAEKFIAEQSKSMPESDMTARTIEDQYGALRTEKALDAELRAAHQKYRADVQEKKNARLKETTKKAGEVEYGVSIADNVYAAKPKIKEDWVFEGAFEVSGKLYRRNDFDKLTSADIDPASVKIGDKPLTEHEFAAIAMFGALDPKLGLQAQKKSVSDPAPILQGLQKDGYTQAEAEQIISNSVRNAYTVDILHIETRMNKHFETAVNGGRKRAEEALKAYPQDKSKLADILADGVGYAAEMAGTTQHRLYPGDPGIDGLVQLGGEMLDLAERDPELKAMVKEKFEAKDKAFCDGMNKKIAPFARDGKGLLKPKSFEEAVKHVRQYEKFMDITQKAYDATKALQQADAEGTTLAQDVKRGYIKDILKANMVTAIYEKQHADRINSSKSTGVNDSVLALNKYTDDMSMRIMQAEEADENDIGLGAQSGASTMPTNAPGLISSGIQNRFIEKPPVLQTIGNPEQMEELDRQAEQIMEQDGLDKLDLEKLNNVLYHEHTHPSAYRGDGMILRTAKLAEPQQAGPEQPQLQKQQEQQEIVEEQPQPGGMMV